jgi:rubrerythrin
MTVRGDLERAIAMAEAARGNYLLFATESADDSAQQVFNDMAEDMQRHVTVLESRREYLDEHNELNQMLTQDAGGAGQEQSKQGQDKQGQEQQGQEKQGKQKQKQGH